MGLLPKAIKIFPNRIGFETACENPNKKKVVLKLKYMSRNKKIQNTNKPTVAICGLRKIIDYARATSTAAAAAAAAASAALPLVLGVCDLCCTAVMRRLSIDATGGRCAVCAWGVLWDVRVSPQSRKHDKFCR